MTTALIIHKRMITGEIEGFSLCDTKFSVGKFISRNGRFMNIFHDGSPKSMVVKRILNIWGKPVFDEALNDGPYVINKDTVFTNSYEIVQKMFELSIEYRNLY